MNSFVEDLQNYTVGPSARWTGLSPALQKKHLHERATALCSLSYYSRYSIREELGSDYMYWPGFRGAYQFGFGYQDGTRLWLVFRGSDDLQDWVLNLSSLPTLPIRPFPKRHIGFQQAWEALESQVYALLDQKRDRYMNIAVVGHSLGGAIATLAAFDLAKKGYPVSEVITLGAPKAGGQKFVDAYNAAANNLGRTLAEITDRIVTDGEIVDRVPSRLIGFRHVGGNTYVAQTGFSIEPPILTETNVTANLYNPPVLVALVLTGLARRVGNHLRDVYSDSLNVDRTEPVSESYSDILSKALKGDPAAGGKLAEMNKRIQKLSNDASQMPQQDKFRPFDDQLLNISSQNLGVQPQQEPIKRLRKPKGGFFRLHPMFWGQALLVVTLYASVLWQVLWLIFTIPYGDGTTTWAPLLEYTPYALLGSLAFLIATVLISRIKARSDQGKT